jgi:hypothetical protein
MGPRTAAAALLLGVAIAGAARADQAPAVTHAIALYQSFEDAKAARAFRAILAAAPSRAVAAKAHLYLGLIAVNQLDAERAIREFTLALKSDPTVDVGPGSSPKARLTFEEARHELEGQLAVAAPTPTPTATLNPPSTPTATGTTTTTATLIPAATTTEPEPAVAAAEPSTRWHSHALALVFGGVGLVSGVLAIYGGVQVLNFNSQVSSANATPGSVTYPQTLGPQSSAQGWAPWVIPLAVLGVLGVAGGCFTW